MQGEQGTPTHPQAQQGRGAACLQGKQPLGGEQAGVMGPCRGDGGLLMTQGNQRGQRKCGTLGKVRT